MFFFPYLTKFKKYQAEADAEKEFRGFEYIDVPSMDPTDISFFAKVRSRSSDREPVVKFVNRYCTEAHEPLVKEGMAVRLPY